MELSTDGESLGVYFCTFFQRHPKDNGLPDNHARWWPEWRELEWSTDHSVYEFGERILFQPRQKPNLEKYGKFGIDIDLTKEGVTLVGPFDFDTKEGIALKSFVCDDQWVGLSSICQKQSITPPTLSRSARRLIASATAYRARLPPLSVQDSQNHPSSLVSMSCLFSKKKGKHTPS